MSPDHVPPTADTAFEQRLAAFLLKTRQTGYTLGNHYQGMIKDYLLLVGAVAVGITYFSLIELPPLAYGMAGAFLGVLVRDYGIARGSRKVWNVQSKFLDWEKVRRTVAGEPLGGE
jgi:hypothetical protein